MSENSIVVISGPGLLIDGRYWANLGKILITYLLTKKAKIFKAENEDVMKQRRTDIREECLDDFLFTSVMGSYTGEEISTNAVAQSNKAMATKVKTTLSISMT